jgi:hypothetical protein
VSQGTDCKGCRGTVRLAQGEVQRLLAEYLRGSEAQVVDEETYARRMAVCGECEDLQYGTTCRHCGCLVAIRAKLADKACPGLPTRWAEG